MQAQQKKAREVEVARTSRRRPRLARRLAESSGPFVMSAVVLLAWQVIVPLADLPELILPTPVEIARRIVGDFRLLLTDARVTLLEVLYGFAAAVLIGIPLALGIFYSRVFEKTFYPLLVALQTVPKVAVAPVLVIWFGFGLAPKVIISFMIAFFPIVISTVVGLQSLEKEMVYLVRSMGATELQTFVKIRLPAALPSIFGGFKVGIGLAVVGAVIGEYVAAESGLGYRQLTANAQFDSPLNFAALVCIALMGVVTFLAVQGLERLVVRGR